ncbi:MAG: hemolysin family protein [Sedimentisphaeraceae bacterium JB056]
MDFLLQNAVQLCLMLVLLILSAAFSGTETALFKLSKHQRDKMRNSNNNIDSIIVKLLSVPGNLLTVLLFGNLLINVLYFAISGAISISLSRNGNHLGATLQGVISLLILVMTGEMLPKSFAYSHTIFFAHLTAVPVFVLLKIFAPLLKLFDLLIIVPAVRIFTPMIPSQQKITTDHLKLLVNETSKLDVDQESTKILNEIIELRELKVKDIMRHRMDMVIAPVDTQITDAVRMMAENKIKKLPVYIEDSDKIIGIISLRTLLTSNPTDLMEALQPVTFVPEQKKADSLLEFFRKEKRDIAIVVDEYGGISGLITIKDIIYELLGAGRSDIYGIIEQTGPMSYRLGGDLPVHDWLDITGMNNEPTKYTTIGGFVTALLDKIPTKGDKAVYQNISFEVEKVYRNRIQTLIVELI